MIPDPLHPAIVHFPIAFIALGALCIITAFFIHDKTFLLVSCGLLVLGAVSAYFAEQTGSDAYDTFKKAFPNAKNILDSHADSASWTVQFAICTAALSLIVVFLRDVKWRKFIHLLTIVLSLILTYSMYKTARLGGDMVYGDALGLSESNISKTLDDSTHTHEGPDAHRH